MFPIQIHHTPGRLRLKNLALATDLTQAARCAVFLRGLRGVRSAVLNARTGSFVIHYCPDTLAPASLLALVNMHGGFGRLAPDGGHAGLPASRGSGFGAAMREAALAKTVELGVTAIFRRLL